MLVSTGAKILGPFRVGDNARIGANAVVLHEVEAGSTVVGVPGHAVQRDHGVTKPSMTLDQISIPDPVSQEMCQLLRRIYELEQRLAKLEAEKSERA